MTSSVLSEFKWTGFSGPQQLDLTLEEWAVPSTCTCTSFRSSITTIDEVSDESTADNFCLCLPLRLLPVTLVGVFLPDPLARSVSFLLPTDRLSRHRHCTSSTDTMRRSSLAIAIFDTAFPRHCVYIKRSASSAKIRVYPGPWGDFSY